MTQKANILLARKPISEKTIAENVLKHGTGGINIDGSRIGKKTYTDDEWKKRYGTKMKNSDVNIGNKIKKDIDYNKLPKAPEGRFPANIIFDEEAGQLLDEQSGISKGKVGMTQQSSVNNIYNGFKSKGDTKINDGIDDKGGASRFFKNINDNEY